MNTSRPLRAPFKVAVLHKEDGNPLKRLARASIVSHLPLKSSSLPLRHSVSMQVNPWSMTPLPRSLAALQHSSLLLAAQQQAVQHALLKHILSCSDLNSRVRGIAAYEEYEALLRGVKGSHYGMSLEELEVFSREICVRIEKIYDHHPRLQHHYSEMQRRILQAAWQTSRELHADENRISPRFLQIKRIQHCWIIYHCSIIQASIGQ